jgi:internalin A
LELLGLADNNVTDLTPLSGLALLRGLALDANGISDLSPLVANPGLGNGDYLSLESNPIDCAEQADNIRTLYERGVEVIPDCSLQ